MTRNMSVMTRVSSLAIAAALTASAAAQSLLGDPTVTFGSVNITEGASTTDLDVLSTTAVIDWTPDDNLVGNFGAIAFQNSGTTATFSSASDFAVLNRINVADPSRLVFMDGVINSLVGETIGGSIYFYSPSGFVIGANAVINVGSMLLSASPIAVDGNGNFISGTSVTFNQAPNSAALINTVAGSQISANGSGSYVALVAPEITHHGTIRTDGAAALVSAEAATINFSPDGLFDIQVTVGTDASTGIHVEGGTITRNSATEGVYDHRAYLVAVAKNDAVTMLINNGGSVGFDTATSAAVEDNVVVLSGGYDISGGDHWTTSGVSEVPLTITNATLSTNVDAQVTGGAAINSVDGALTFGGDLSIIGGETTTTGGNVLIDAGNGNPLTIAGNLYARAFRRGADGTQTGLITRLGAETGSTVTVGGDVMLDSDSFGAAATGDGEDGTQAIGGNAQINIGANSALNVTGSVNVHADAYGGDNFYSNGAGGNAIGGQALVMAINGGATVNIGGSVLASAQGYGGSAGECSVCNITGGAGIGGNASVHTNVGSGNSMQIDGDVTVIAAGFGGAGDAQAGAGIGGTANIGAANNSGLTIAADTEVNASGTGGYGFDTTNGGLGRGGTARISTDTNGSIDLTGPVFVTANGQGGDGANGGTGTGGLAQIVAFQGDIHAFNNVLVSANSDGGFVTFGSGTGTGGSGLADIETTITPAMTEASLIASGGTLTVDGLTTVSANASGGDGGFDGGDGGDAVAAGIAGTTSGGAVIHAANSDNGPSVIQLGSVIVTADAQGGQGGDGQGGSNGSNGGNGGSATGGKAVITAAAGSGDLTAGATILSASATGGDGGSGGSGDGGSGGNGGDGGSAEGGFINVGSESGNVNFAQGANNGTASYTTIVALATATGGDGGDGGFGSPGGVAGNGGDAIGGNSVLLVRGSEVTVGDVLLDGSATGGDGGLSPDTTNGDGGDATTGEVGVVVTNRFNQPDQRGTLNAGNIVGTAVATGGTGGTGNGQSLSLGGSNFEVVNSNATINSVSLVVSADGLDLNAPETFNSPIAVVNGAVDISGGFVFQAPGTISVHADNGTLNAASFNVTADNFVHDPARSFPASVGTISANNIFMTTNQDLIIDAHLVSLNGVGLTAPGLIDLENVTSANGPLALTAGTTVTAGNLSAGNLVAVNAGGDIALGDVAANGGQAIIQSTGAGIATGTINAATFIGLNAPLGIATGDLNAGDFVSGQSDGPILTGNIVAGTTIDLFSTGGGIATGDLTGTEIDLEANGNVSFANVDADILDFDATGAVTGGNILAFSQVGGDAQGAITLGDITVGPGVPQGDDFSVGIASETSITVGDVSGTDRVGFATFGDLVTGDLSASDLVMTLVGGDISTGSITTQPDGTVYMGHASMFLDAGGGEDNFDASLVLALDPVPTGGSITINGDVSTGTFRASAGSNLTTGAIDADLIQALAGGLASINGIWSAPFIELWSDDIEIGANGGMDGGSDGLIRLVSTNATQALIGDGLTGTGYALSNAEFGRLSAGNVQIAARSDASAAIDMLIGDLSVTGPSAGSTIEDPLGALVFATGDPETQVAGGVIRIVGDLTATGFSSDNAIEFYTGRFELDAATGLLEITSNGTNLSGELYIEADRIHVASGEILDQLAIDPHYAGYQEDLNAPAEVQRPDGVIRAGGIDIFPTEAVLVQNTGTAETPAGFLTFGEGPLFSESDTPAGPIELIINGQLITEGGTLTGIDVRDFLIDDANIGIFTENSTINGCPLTGECGVVEPPEPPIPPGFTPTPGIQQEIVLINDNLLPPPEFGNEDFIDDNDEETDDGSTSPIEPPDPLFDTSELGEEAKAAGTDVGTSMRSNPSLTEPGDVDDPVSGSGNPGLIEKPVTPPSKEEMQP